MPIDERHSKVWNIFPSLEDTDFIVGKDSFESVQIDSSGNENGFWYFINTKRGLITRFILEQTEQTEKVCKVVLIKKENDKFTPRFTFQIWNTTKKAAKQYRKGEIDHNFIKAHVNFNDCHENFSKLISFMKELEDIEFESESIAVIDKEKKDIFENVSKELALQQYTERFGEQTTDKDIAMLQGRRDRLEHFKSLLNDKDFFEKERIKLGEKKRREDVWQNFFEQNSWIFGYGLQLISCENLDDKKLEQTVVGNDIIDGSGKRIDALLKTKGSISKTLFCEIKTHLPNLLMEKYDRPSVYVPAKDLRGAVAQVQKTIHKVNLKLQNNFYRMFDAQDNPTGEEILFVKPRGIVVIGKLDDFKTDNGINYEKLSSFEIYRQQISGIEILTFDELYERARFIVED